MGGHVAFMGSSTAANASFVCQGGGDGSFGGTLAYAEFFENSSAGSATLIAEGDPDPLQNGFGGVVIFTDQSKAENATLIASKGRGAEGGNIVFEQSATGDRATVKLFSNAIAGIPWVAICAGNCSGSELPLRYSSSRKTFREVRDTITT